MTPQPPTESLPCPGCTTLLPLEATSCPICLRPRTRQEIMRGYAKLREDAARRRRRPFQILAAVLVLGAGGKLVADHRAALTAAARSAGGKAYRWADSMRDPANYAGRPAGEGEPVPPEGALRNAMTRQASALSEAAGMTAPAAPVPSAASPSAAAVKDRPAAPARPKPLAKNAWRVSGTVYDLETLRPVPDATVTFSREKNAASATTDANGAYEIDLAKGDGWTVSVLSKVHRRGQMLDIDPPYRERDADERRAALEHITDGDLAPAPVSWKSSQSRPRLDLVVTAAAWTGADPLR